MSREDLIPPLIPLSDRPSVRLLQPSPLQSRPKILGSEAARRKLQDERDSDGYTSPLHSRLRRSFRKLHLDAKRNAVSEICTLMRNLQKS